MSTDYYLDVFEPNFFLLDPGTVYDRVYYEWTQCPSCQGSISDTLRLCQVQIISNDWYCLSPDEPCFVSEMPSIQFDYRNQVTHFDHIDDDFIERMKRGWEVLRMKLGVPGVMEEDYNTTEEELFDWLKAHMGWYITTRID